MKGLHRNPCLCMLWEINRASARKVVEREIERLGNGNR